MRFLVTDQATQTTAEFYNVMDAMKQAGFLISLGHEVVMQKGGN